MSDQWIEFKRQPGVFFRISEHGKLELLGSNLAQLRDWTAIAEEIRREWFLSRHRPAAPQRPDPDQLDLFPLRGLRRLEDIPPLRRNRRSA
jgi:hypothetical protein